MQKFPFSLAEHPFFKGLEQRLLEPILGAARGMEFPPDRYLLREGEHADAFFLIYRGRVALETPVPGRGRVTIQTLGEGEVLSWSWLVPPYNWRFDARAVEPTLAVGLEGAALRAACERNHELGYELLKRLTTVMARRLEATRLQLLDVYGVHS